MKWLRSHPLLVAGLVCSMLLLLAVALGLLTNSEFVQAAAAHFVGGILAALVVFGMADIAFGFTQRRSRQKKAVVNAIVIVGTELARNSFKLEDLVEVLREGKLDARHPILQAETGLQKEYWELFIKSPVSGNLPDDLVWRIHDAYFVSFDVQRALRELRASQVSVGALGWSNTCEEYLPKVECALQTVRKTMKDFDVALMEH